MLTAVGATNGWGGRRRATRGRHERDEHRDQHEDGAEGRPLAHHRRRLGECGQRVHAGGHRAANQRAHHVAARARPAITPVDDET